MLSLKSHIKNHYSFPDKEKRIHADVIAQLAELTIFGLAGTLINSVVVVTILWKAADKSRLLYWFFSLILISILRIFLQVSFEKFKSNDRSLNRWKNCFLIALLASGIVWGSSGIALLQKGSIAYESFLAFVLGGMVAGSVGVYSAMITAFLFFSIPALFPLIIRLALLNDPIHLAMSFMLLLFWTIMLFTAIKLHENLIKAFKLKNENIDLISGLKNEINARKAAEEELAGQKNEIEKIVEKRTEQLKVTRLRQNEAVIAGNVGLWDWDFDSNRIQYSKEWKQQIGYEEDEIGDDFDEWKSRVHPDDIDPALKNIEQSIAGIHKAYRSEFRFRHKDGSFRLILAQGSIVRDKSGHAVRMLGSHIDITERKRMEEEILKAQKLESLGILAGGIAHDFNNILSAILGNVSMAREQTAPGSEISELLSDAEKASKNARKLTRQLLTFAKGGVPLKEITSMCRIIKECVPSVTTDSISGCEFSVDDNLWPVEIDSEQMTEAISNIAVNARQAMPEGGIIYITAVNHVLDEDNAFPLRPGKYIRISIKDQGEGIPEICLSKIFDPYFTTKQDSNGLGLATAYSVISKHGGLLTAESQPGNGATFHIYLPASEKEIPVKEEARVVKGYGNVLVMDDEVFLLKVYGKVLEKLGYSYGLAEHGAEAVRLYEEALKTEDPYDIVILDLIIPGGMGGEETIKRLLEIDPDVKAIVSSGYSDNEILANFRDYGFKGRILKPFDFKTLSMIMHNVLSGKPE